MWGLTLCQQCQSENSQDKPFYLDWKCLQLMPVGGRQQAVREECMEIINSEMAVQLGACMA